MLTFRLPKARSGSGALPRGKGVDWESASAGTDGTSILRTVFRNEEREDGCDEIDKVVGCSDRGGLNKGLPLGDFGLPFKRTGAA